MDSSIKVIPALKQEERHDPTLCSERALCKIHAVLRKGLGGLVVEPPVSGWSGVWGEKSAGFSSLPGKTF